MEPMSSVRQAFEDLQAPPPPPARHLQFTLTSNYALKTA